MLRFSGLRFAVLAICVLAGTASAGSVFEGRGDRSLVSVETGAIIDHILTAPDLDQRKQIDKAFETLRASLFDFANSGFDKSEMVRGSKLYIEVQDLTDGFVGQILDRVWTRFGGALDSVLSEPKRNRFVSQISDGTFSHDEFKDLVRSKSGKDMRRQLVEEMERSINHMILQGFIEPLRELGWRPQTDSPKKSG